MYELRKRRYNQLLQKQQRVERNISNLRLVVFTVGIGAGIFSYIRFHLLIMGGILVAFTALFIYLVIYHEKLIDKVKYIGLLIEINDDSIKRLQGEWHTFRDDGAEFANGGHNYSDDLDIFGRSSLYQWIVSAKTHTGRENLKDLLSDVTGGSREICERQKAVAELARRLSFRQRLMAEGMKVEKGIRDPKELIAWGLERDGQYGKPWIIAAVRICPIITVLLVTAGYFMKIIPSLLPTIALLIQFGLVSYRVRERYRRFSIFENYSADLRAYYRLLNLFEKQSFQTEKLQKLQAGIKSEAGTAAYKQLDKLSSIVDSISNRRNIYYIIFNTLTLWDFQSLIALERWKEESGCFLKTWFDTLGQVEALASLAVIGFENPDWVTPIVTEESAVLKAKGLGHPLLGLKRVRNDLSINDQVKVLLITGSNMSGKSTLLRTIGINLVLAYAGAPVCASEFEAPIMEINTCMRVRDDLEGNISSFYAELLRIKRIVEAAEAGRKVFFLLDEIFKGTNSQDRHIGASVLINKLSQTKAVGMVSTHDLELCELEQNNPKIANYHFQEYYEEGRIHFDYKLRMGPSTTRNALHLMRLAGIEVEEADLSK